MRLNSQSFRRHKRLKRNLRYKKVVFGGEPDDILKATRFMKILILGSYRRPALEHDDPAKNPKNPPWKRIWEML